MAVPPMTSGLAMIIDECSRRMFWVGNVTAAGTDGENWQIFVQAFIALVAPSLLGGSGEDATLDVWKWDANLPSYRCTRRLTETSHLSLQKA